MKTRIITAIIGIILVLGLIILGNWILTFAVLAIAGIALTEYGCMLERLGIKIRFKISCIFLALIILSAYTGILKFFVSGLFGSFLILCFSILKISKKSINDLMYTVFGVLYLGIGFGSLLFLRQNNEFFDIGLSSINNGVFTILFALIGTWASDSFAYLVGKRFGKHKMAPHISPNKTLEGLFGGIVGTIVLCSIFSIYFGLVLWKGVLCGAIVSVVAPIGDLFESYLKRACDVKDSGKLLPGHGGMLDRFDSILFVSPAMLIVLYLIQ
ncbi:phosphatidate cytidylyltransferase [Dialister micraerophilus]|uniref:phosphatidate cytidylyltransferase n=1 Tax=Dialister micraerophilus TaxID=309120 RepID=UPI0023F53082|nr:phosphatidate cytidylyltransferase [Dialister micraerophilus]